MRRALAGLILALSLLLASLAWSGFVLLHTVLDPGRSDRLADQMLDNTVLRQALVDAVADSIQSSLPVGASVPRAQLEAASSRALDDPRVESVVRDGIVRLHQNALDGVDEPVTIDPAAFGAAARDALVQSRPELGTILPAAPSLAVTLPDTGLGFLGDVRDFLDRTVELAAAVSLAGVVLALVVTTNRPAVLRRVAYWAFAASAFWLLVGYGLPWAAERVLPESAALFAAGVDVFLGAMILPALALAGAGVVLLVVALMWDAARRRRPDGRRDRVPLGSDGRPLNPIPQRSAGPAGAVAGGWPAGPPMATAGRPAAGPRAGAAVAPPAGPGGWTDPAGDVTHIHPLPGAAPGATDRTIVRPPAPAPWEGRGSSSPHASGGGGIPSWDQTRVDAPVGGPTSAHGGSAPAPPRPAEPNWLDGRRPPVGPSDDTPTHAVRPVEAPVPDGEAASGDRPRSGPRWVEGVGYLDD